MSGKREKPGLVARLRVPITAGAACLIAIGTAKMIGGPIALAVASWVTGAALGYLLASVAVARGPRQSENRPEKQKMGTMDMVLIVEAVFLAVYTAAALAVFWHTGSEPATLTTCVFSVCGLENGFMGWITTTKSKHTSK